MASLPLFPLGTVLMPGGSLPLQLFEPRYLRLLRDLAERPPTEREFGVIALRRGIEVGPEAALELHDIGCVARITRARPVPGGERVLVQTRGVRRFRLEHLDPTADTPYLTGEVHWLAETPGAGPDELGGLAERVAAALAAYRRALGAASLVLDGSPAECSYAVADAMVLDAADRQRLLAAPTTAARLRLARTLLHRETALVGRLGALPGPVAFGEAQAN